MLIRTEGRTLRVEGEVDLSNAHELAGAIQEACAGGDEVLIDLSGLTFIDSSGLHAIDRVAATVPGGTPVVLLDVPPRVARLIELLGLDRSRRLALRPRGD